MISQQLTTSSESKVRKKWLISFFSFFTLGAIGCIGDLVSEPMNLRTLIDSAHIIIWSLITYHFAYNKKGTKWLMFILIVIPFQLTFLYIAQFFSYSPEELLLTLLLTPFMSYFWLNCYRLRKYNKQMIKQTVT